MITLWPVAKRLLINWLAIGLMHEFAICNSERGLYIFTLDLLLVTTLEQLLTSCILSCIYSLWRIVALFCVWTWTMLKINKNITKTQKKLHFHSFPNASKRNERWIKADRYSLVKGVYKYYNGTTITTTVFFHQISCIIYQILDIIYFLYHILCNKYNILLLLFELNSQYTQPYGNN